MMKWYLVNVWGGFENRAKLELEKRVRILGIQHKVPKVIIPVRKVKRMNERLNKEVWRDERFLSGIVLVKMLLDTETYILVRSNPHVGNFVGWGGTHTPYGLKFEECRNIFLNMKKRIDETPILDLDIGDEVKVKQGPFTNMKGVVDGFEEEDRVKVSVIIFGRVLEMVFQKKALELYEEKES